MIELDSKYIACGALVASLGSLLVSIRSLRNSSRSLRIAEAESLNRSKSVSFYLAQSRRLKLENGKVFACFNITVTNCATTPHTLPRIYLAVKYKEENSQLSEIHIPAEREPIITSGDMELSIAPLNLSPRSAITTWFAFHFPEQTRRKEIKLYKVIAETSEGTEVNTQAHFIYDTVFFK